MVLYALLFFLETHRAECSPERRIDVFLDIARCMVRCMELIHLHPVVFTPEANLEFVNCTRTAMEGMSVIGVVGTPKLHGWAEMAYRSLSRPSAALMIEVLT